ncbi:hypothetical protein DL768_004779 [Monosporascus sp. mg162]|nr:hypothetical protein DL768_004779 [Monosporascus sp. mg162]
MASSRLRRFRYPCVLSRTQSPTQARRPRLRRDPLVVSVPRYLAVAVVAKHPIVLPTQGPGAGVGTQPVVALAMASGAGQNTAAASSPTAPGGGGGGGGGSGLYSNIVCQLRQQRLNQEPQGPNREGQEEPNQQQAVCNLEETNRELEEHSPALEIHNLEQELNPKELEEPNRQPEGPTRGRRPPAYGPLAPAYSPPAPTPTPILVLVILATSAPATGFIRLLKFQHELATVVTAGPYAHCYGGWFCLQPTRSWLRPVPEIPIFTTITQTSIIPAATVTIPSSPASSAPAGGGAVGPGHGSMTPPGGVGTTPAVPVLGVNPTPPLVGEWAAGPRLAAAFTAPCVLALTRTAPH